jgi:hypothetical protein
MKNVQQKLSNTLMDNRLELSNPQVMVPPSKLSYGSTENKYPVVLDGGRTIIYITDKRREGIIRLRYALREGKKTFFPFAIPEF